MSGALGHPSCSQGRSVANARGRPQSWQVAGHTQGRSARILENDPNNTYCWGENPSPPSPASACHETLTPWHMWRGHTPTLSWGIPYCVLSPMKG